MTLNGGFSVARGDTISSEDRALIDEFIRTKGVQKCLPAGVSGSESSRATNELVARKRREERKKSRQK